MSYLGGLCGFCVDGSFDLGGLGGFGELSGYNSELSITEKAAHWLFSHMDSLTDT
jgi:hypothetical protein